HPAGSGAPLRLWEDEHERGPLARLRGDPKLAVVGASDLAREVQPEACSRDGGGTGLRGSLEALEEPLEVRPRDADAVVGDGDRGAAAPFADGAAHLSALRRILHGVVQQVPDGHPDTRSISL